MKDRRSKAKQAEVIRSLRKKVKTLEKTALARKRAEDALKQSEERFRLFVESTSDWIWAIDRDGRHIYSNPAVEKILGYRAKELEGKDSLLFMHEEDRKMVAGMLPKLITKKSGWSNLIVRWRHKDNTFRYLESNAAPILDDKGKLVGYQGSDRDITERTRVEEALKKLLSQLQATLESTDDAILVVDTESRITNYNKRFLELWQIPKNIMATRNDNAALQYVLNQLKEPEKFLAKVRDLYSHPHEESFDVLEFKDGRIFERFSQPQKLDGKSIGRVWSFRDVTKRKHAEKALQESVEQFRNLAEKTPNMIFINQGGRIVYANEKCNEIMGYTSEELLSPDFDFRRLIAPESLSTVIEKFEEHQRGKEVPPYEYVLITKQGQRLHTIQTTRLITFHGERAILGIITDITERKQAEEAVAASEASYRGLFNGVGEAIYVQDREGRFLDVNSSSERMYGYSRETLIGKTPLFVSAPGRNDMDKVGKMVERAFAGESQRFEFWGRRANGEIFPKEVRLVRGTYFGQDVVIASADDITERKRAEEALRENERRFHSIVRNLNQAYFEADRRGAFTYFNPGLLLISGYSEEELHGSVSFRIVVEEHRKNVIASFKRWMEEKRTDMSMEFMVQTKSGRKFWVEQVTHFEFDAKGAFVKATNILRDIQERKHAEEANLLLAQTLKSAQDCISITDLDDKILFVNSAFLATYGYNEEDLIGKNIAMVRPASVSLLQVAEILPSTLRGEWHGELINRRKDGTEFPIELWTSIVNDSEGNPIAAVGVARDITDRKRTEEALRESEARHRQLVDLSPDAIVVHSGGRFEYVNPAAVRLFGGTVPQDIIGKPIIEFVHPDYRDTVRQRVQKISEGSNVPLLEERFIQLDGTIIDVEVAAMPLTYQNKPSVQVVIRDITERKRAEEDLKKSEDKFRELFENAPIGYHELDAEGRVTNVNLTELGMLGYAKEEMLGRPVWEFAGGGERSRKRVLEKLTGVVPPNKNAERMYVKKDGNTIPVMVDESLLRNQRGEISGMRTVIQDITEKKRAEQVLQESNAFNEQLVRTLPFGMDIVDERGEILFMSNAMKKLVGSDALGSRCWSAYKDDKTQCYDCPLHEGIDFAEPKKLESTGVLGGKTFQISHIGMMYQGKKAMLEVFVDVTERKQAEGALRQSEAKYRSLFEESKDVVYISTPNGKFFDINPAGVELLGYDSKEEILRLETGQNLFADPHQREEMRKQIEVQGFIKNFEEVLRRKDGQKITVLDTATAVRDPKGRTILFRGIMRDVTKEKQLEEELTQIQKLESIGTLASGIAHDFNNILGIVLGYSSFIERVADDPEKLSQSVQSINAAVQRGASLVQQILTFARKAEVVFGPIDVNMMIKEIVKMLRETFPKTIEISLQLDRALPFITADATQLHQAFLNISVNARDAMPIGGVLGFKTGIVTGASLRNAFSDVPDGNYAHVSVTDTGIGMDDATRAHIFDPFFTTKEKGKGTGLGLSVVYGVMKKHNGFIDVQSEPGKGTTFNLYFPIPEESAHGEGRTVEDRGEIPGGTETILIVEDEEALLTMLKVILELKGYHALTAVDGLEALALYREHNAEIALVMTDVGLPKISGDQLFFELKKVNPSVRVVLMSGYMDPGIKSEIFKAGVHDFVQKPYDPNEVLMKVRESIDRE